MAKLQWTGGLLEIELETVEPIAINDPNIAELGTAISAAYAAAKFCAYKWDPAPDEGGAKVYNIEMELECPGSGRIWRHKIVFDVPTDPGLTFDVPDLWRRSEYNAHLRLRLMVGKIVTQFGLVKLQVLRP